METFIQINIKRKKTLKQSFAPSPTDKKLQSELHFKVSILEKGAVLWTVYSISNKLSA